MIPEPIILAQQGPGGLQPIGVATGDQVPPGCTCTHYITVFIPGSTPAGLTRAVCDKIQCNGGGNPGAGCWVLRVEDRQEIFPCGGAFGPPPAGSTCGEPAGVGSNRYGILVRTYRWVRCKGTSTGGGFGGVPIVTPINEPSWPEGEVVPNPVAESSINNTSIELFEPFEIIENSNNITSRNISVMDSSQKEYIVILKGNDKIEHKVFMEKMISTNAVSLTETTSKIPSRSVDIINKQYFKNVHYFLTDNEVTELRKDPRVEYVIIPDDQLYGPPIVDIHAIHTQVGGFHRRTYPIPGENDSLENHMNWGLIRSSSKTNPYTVTQYYPASDNPVGPGRELAKDLDQMISPQGEMANLTYSYGYDGTGVDVVIVDDGICADHPEWENAYGNTRLKEINWEEFTDTPRIPTTVTGNIIVTEYQKTNVITTNGLEVVEVWIQGILFFNGPVNVPAGEDLYNWFILVPKPDSPGVNDNSVWQVSGLITDGNGLVIGLDVYEIQNRKNGYYPQAANFRYYNESNKVAVDAHLGIEREYIISPQSPWYYTDSDGHGTHVASTAVGKYNGWAKNANIYFINFRDGACLAKVSKWHNAKPKDVATGFPLRPTIINCSWHVTNGPGFQSNYFGLEKHNYEPEVSNYGIYSNLSTTDSTQKCQYSSHISNPIAMVVVNGITYGNVPGTSTTNIPEDQYMSGIIPAGLTFSDPRTLMRYFTAKYGIAPRTSILRSQYGDPNNIYQYSDTTHTNIPYNQTDIKQLSTSVKGVSAILNDGTLVFWGATFEFDQGYSPRGAVEAAGEYANKKYKQILMTSLNTVGLGTDNLVYAWGNNGAGQCNIPSDLGPCKQIAAGYAHTIALREDGTVRAWGYNAYDQCNIPSDLGVCKQIAGGQFHTIALREDGTVRAWGLNVFGECNIPSDLGVCTQIAGGAGHTVALRQDGIVRAWGDNSQGQCNVPSDLGICKQIAGGGQNTIAIQQSGIVRAWGRNGNDVPSDLGVCKQIGISSIVLGENANKFTAYAITTDNKIRMWGSLNPLSFSITLKFGSNVTEQAPNGAPQGPLLTNLYLNELTTSPGIHVCIAAGNDANNLARVGENSYNDHVYFYRRNIGIEGGNPNPDFNPLPLSTTTSDRSLYWPIYYKRKNIPYNTECIVVGSYHNSTYFKGRAIESRSHFSAYGSAVDVYAPGGLVQGASSRYSAWGVYGHTYGFSQKTDPYGKRYLSMKMSGTSMSCPQMCGMGALILQKFPTFTQTQLKEYIKNNSIPGLLKHQDTSIYDTTKGDKWWSYMTPDGITHDIDDFNKFPYGQKYTLGPNSVLANIAYMLVDVPVYVSTKINHAWYSYQDPKTGYDQFILIGGVSGENINNIYNNIKSKTARGSSLDWYILRDNTTDTLNSSGANRIQISYDKENT